MNLVAKLLILGVLGTKLVPASQPVPEPQVEQRVFMVWGAGCLKGLSVGLNTRLEVRTNDDGSWDRKKIVLIAPVVDYIEGCGHYEVRRGEK